MIRHDQGNYFDRQPPCDLENEQGLLAALIIDPEQIHRAARQLTGADFHDPANGRLFEAIVTLWDAGKPINDVRLLIPGLRSLGITEAEWSVSQIIKLINDGGTGSNAPWYVMQIRRHSDLRKELDTALEWLARIFDPKAQPAENARWLDARLQHNQQNRTADVRRIGEVAGDVLDAIETAAQTKRGTMMGLPRVDEAIGGLMPGELVILAARPGQGKTSLAMQVAQYSAGRNRQVLFVSLEMTAQELTQRALCSLAQVDSRHVRRGQVNAAERQSLVNAAAELHSLPLRIWAPPVATVADIRGIARLHAKTVGLQVLVVDYVGLIRPSDPKRQRYEQVAEVTAGLKALAKELEVPVLALCQLNREAEQKEPTLSMLRESGSIEQDADVVLFLHHAQRHEPVSLIVGKHRAGETGTMQLTWVPTETRFEEPTATF